jgi:hypothetical protein
MNVISVFGNYIHHIKCKVSMSQNNISHWACHCASRIMRTKFHYIRKVSRVPQHLMFLFENILKNKHGDKSLIFLADF